MATVMLLCSRNARENDARSKSAKAALVFLFRQRQGVGREATVSCVPPSPAMAASDSTCQPIIGDDAAVGKTGKESDCHALVECVA